MKGLGSNVMLVVPGGVSQAGVRLGARPGSALTEEDAQAIALRGCPRCRWPPPRSRASGQGRWPATPTGAPPSSGPPTTYLEAREWALHRRLGLFDAAELAGLGQGGRIVGQTVARELFGDADPLDQADPGHDIACTVVGVLRVKGQNAMGQDQDDVVLVPHVHPTATASGGGASGKLQAASGSI